MIMTEGRRQSPWGQGSLLEQLLGFQHEGSDEKISPPPRVWRGALYSRSAFQSIKVFGLLCLILMYTV